MAAKRLRARKRPRVLTECVADAYASDGERIFEISSECGGGLISLRCVDGELVVTPYRLDRTVIVREASYSD